MRLLEKWMSDNDVTDQKLSVLLGVSRVHASRLRRGICKPSLAKAHKLAEITEIDAPKFIFDEAA